MKASLKSLAADMKPTASAAPPKPATKPAPAKNYRTAETRTNTRQLAGHFPTADVHAFRILAAERDMDVQELMAEGFNMVFERYGKPNRMVVTSGRRKRDA